MNEVVRALPYGVSSGKSAASRQPDDNLLTETIHVLLVDDERLSRLVVGNLLKKCKYKGEFRLLAGNPSNVKRVYNVLMIFCSDCGIDWNGSSGGSAHERGRHLSACSYGEQATL